MGLYVEVESIEKGCKVIINLDTVMEIAPLFSGGCEISFPDQASVGGRRTMKVKDNYTMFQQFAIQPVSSEDIAKKVKSLKETKASIDVPKFAG